MAVGTRVKTRRMFIAFKLSRADAEMSRGTLVRNCDDLSTPIGITCLHYQDCIYRARYCTVPYCTVRYVRGWQHKIFLVGPRDVIAAVGMATNYKYITAAALHVCLDQRQLTHLAAIKYMHD